MKLLINEFFYEPINISEKVTYIVVEDPSVFFKMVKTINNQVLNKPNVEELFILLKNETKLDISKSIIMFSDILNFDINSKKIKNELIKKVEQDIQILNESRLLQINNLLLDYLEGLFSNYSINVNYIEKIELGDLLKLFKLEVCNEDDSLLITLMNWMTSFTELTKIDTFLFVNLTTFLTQDELEQLDNYSKYNKVSIILFENNCSNFENNKSVNIIDKDLCHIITHKVV